MFRQIPGLASAEKLMKECSSLKAQKDNTTYVVTRLNKDIASQKAAAAKVAAQLEATEMALKKLKKENV